MKSKLKRLQRMLIHKEYDSPLYRMLVVFAFKLWWFSNGILSRKKKQITKLIKENVDESKFNNKRYVKKTMNDIIYCRFNYGIQFDRYFYYKFPMLSHEGRTSLVGLSYSTDFIRKVNDQSYVEYFDIKSETYRKFKKFYNRELVTLCNKNDFGKFEEFIKSHNKFIRKPIKDYGGHGVKIFDMSEYENLETLFTAVMNKGICVVEELIVQGHELAQFHPQSVNTVRIVSFRENAEKVNIAWCFLRMGMGDSNVDNMSSGGMAAMIEPKTGVVYTAGTDYLNNIHIYHPDTGVKIVGFQLPEWDKLLEILKEVANVLPEVRWVGWDFAYSDKGWSFVEGNSKPGVSGTQITEYKGKKDLFKAMEKLFIEQQSEAANG